MPGVRSSWQGRRFLDQRLDRRDVLRIGAVSAAGILLSGCRNGEEPPSGETPGDGPSPLRLLVTEDPVSLYLDREVLSEANVQFDEIGTWYRFDMIGARPEHEYSARVRHTGDALELSLEIVLAGKLWKSLEARYTGMRPIKRLWVSRGYLHDEEHTTACFPAAETPRPFSGEIWFATFDEDRAISEESRRPYEYGAPPDGDVTLQLHEDYAFSRTWTVHPDGVGHDYTSRWLQGDQVLTEITESVIGLEAMEDVACSALATAQYCDTDFV